MVLSLLFGRKYARARVGAIALDVTISEEHQYSSRVTNFPVENGNFVSDHIINEPEKLTIIGLVSDTPLNILAGFNRSIDAFNRLIDIHRRREIVSVVTGVKVYTSMVMTALNIPRDITSGQSLTFNMQFQKIILDRTVRVSIDPNNPFSRTSDVIVREQVAEATRYPFLGNDPITSLKDQAQTGIDVGIQDLLPIATNLLPSVTNSLTNLRALI